MHYRTFGRRTGLRVSELALGTANFGRGPGAPADPAAARTILDRFADAGGTFLDTADAYQHGNSERVLGELLKGRRDDFVLATKYTRSAAAGAGVATTGNSRIMAIRSLEASLERLGTDHVDLYWVHLPDDVTPTAEIMAAFDDLVRAGKIRYGGLSNFPAWRVAAALSEPGSSSLVGVQVGYSLANRTVDRETLPMAEAFGLGVALYAPLAGGLLTGKYRHGASGRLTAFGDPERGGRSAVVDAVLAVADEVGAPPSQVALAWVLRRAARSTTGLVPVVGPRTPEQLADYLSALDLTLGADQQERLDAASALDDGPTPRAAAIGIDGAQRLHAGPVPVI
jgi:aryl-alcohol dehydrogenase-like predicted oxidoreductase